MNLLYFSLAALCAVALVGLAWLVARLVRDEREAARRRWHP